MPDSIRPTRVIAACAMALLALAGCETQDPATYPITGEECGSEDPVRTQDCRPSVPRGV